MIAGLKPKGFTWIIKDRLAVSERIGGYGFQHRRVRREEEINWIVEQAGITTVITLLPGNQNLHAYTSAGLTTRSVPIGDHPRADAETLFETIRDALSESEDARVLVHREIVDDTVGGLLGGYLVWSGLLKDRILAAAVIQEILGRPLGPEGRSLIPEPAAGA